MAVVGLTQTHAPDRLLAALLRAGSPGTRIARTTSPAWRAVS